MVLAFAVLLVGVLATANLLVAALTVGGNSRQKEVATDIASSVLDCAVQQGGASLLGQLNYGKPSAACGAGSVTEGGVTYTVEQDVTPGTGSCAAPQPGVGNELAVTEMVTWARGAGNASSWWTSGTYTGRMVQETNYAAVPGSAISDTEGEILVIVSDGNSVGQGSVTVTADLGSPTNPTTTLSAASSSAGCVLFANVTPGSWYVTASQTQSGWLGTNEASVADATAFPATVSAGAPTTVPVKYAQAGTITAQYTASSGAVPSNIDQLPLSFYNSGLSTTDPYVPTVDGTASYQVFPFSAPSYTVVAGACGADSAPDGTDPDGQEVTVADGGSQTVTFPLTPIDVVVADATAPNGLQTAVTAQASTSSGAADPNCSAAGELSLQLGSTAVETGAVRSADGRRPPAVTVLDSLVRRARPHRPAAGGGAGARPATEAVALRHPAVSGPWLDFGQSTTTSLSASPSPAVYGQPVTFTVAVSPSTSGTASVTTGSTTLCASVTVTNGSGSCTSSAAPLGSDTVTASFTPSNHFYDSSSGSTSVTVTQDSTTTTVTANENPSIAGQSVTFTATVAGGGGSTATPTGSVTFYDGGTGGTDLGSSTLSSGSATLSTSALPTGADSISAVYGGTSDFAGSTSAALVQQVVAATEFVAGALPYGTFTLTASGTSGGTTYQGSTVVEIMQSGGSPVISVDGTTEPAGSAVIIDVQAVG